VPSPKTIDVVSGADHQVAETALSGALIDDHAPVYVLKLTGGTFTALRHPPGVPAPHGNVLTLTVDATTQMVTDVGYVDAEPDLSVIGATRVTLQ